MNRKNLIDAAMGRIDADLILKNGSVLDVFTGTLKKADVAIKDGYICGVGEYDGKNTKDVSGKIIVPGFIDSHLHIESSMVTPAEYARTVVPHGVTTVIADPHEIANVCGEKGMRFMKENAKNVPMDINFMLPSCVPSVPFEHSGAVLSAEDTRRLAPEFFGIGEMMNYPGICNADEEVLGKLCSDIIDGHAPLVFGKELDAYASAGIKTDHECTSSEELVETVSKGLYVMLREGTLSKDIEHLYNGLTPYILRRCLLCTDDRFIGEIQSDGSIDNCIRRAISLGVSATDAVIMATLNAAECYKMKDKGAVCPSYRADLVVADSLEFNEICAVYKDGVLVAENGKALFEAEISDYADVVNTVHLDKVSAEDFAYEMPEEITAIELIPHSIITKKVTAKKTDTLSKVCVLERHKGLGTKGIGFVTNYGIKNGAVASSIGHDCHNVIVIGDNDEDMALAVNTLGKDGGFSVCSNGNVMGYLPLDIAGLMSSKKSDEVVRIHDELYQKAKELGISDDIDPFLALAFLPLPVIPEIRVTDMGVFDVTKFEFI